VLFYAAYVGSRPTPRLSTTIVVPDHKVYFIPVGCEDEAAFLTGILNSTTVARAIQAYASQLSFGTSLAEYLKLPKYDSADRVHQLLAKLAMRLSHRPSAPSAAEVVRLDDLSRRCFGLPGLRRSCVAAKTDIPS